MTDRATRAVDLFLQAIYSLLSGHIDHRYRDLRKQGQKALADAAQYDVFPCGLLTYQASPRIASVIHP